MTTMTYAEQLRHPNWQKVRLRMLEAAGWRCTECGDKEKTLHVHHKKYVKGRKAWEYSDDELQVLCEDCHQQEHEDQEMLKQVMPLLTKDSYFSPTALALTVLSGYAVAQGHKLPQAIVDRVEITDPNLFNAGFVGGLTQVAPARVALGAVRQLVAAMPPTMNGCDDAVWWFSGIASIGAPEGAA